MASVQATELRAPRGSSKPVLRPLNSVSSELLGYLKHKSVAKGLPKCSSFSKGTPAPGRSRDSRAWGRGGGAPRGAGPPLGSVSGGILRYPSLAAFASAGCEA